MSTADKPRVCLLTETYYPVVGGGETQARALAEGLANQGFGVLVVTRRSDAALPRREQLGPVAVYRAPPAGAAHLKKWGLLLTIWPILIRLRRQYDLIFVSGFRLLGIPAVLVSRLFGKRCILKADSLGEMSGDFFADGLARLRLSPSSRPFRLFLRLRNTVLRQADAFVAISTVVAGELAAHGIPPWQIRRIPNSVDIGRFHPVSTDVKQALRRQFGLPPAARVVIFTGRLVSYKGLPLLLQVWREIQREVNNARLLLVGAGGLDIHNCEAALRAYVAAHDLAESVYFTGNVANVHEYLQASDIFVFPTENEAFGISLIEAMACGLAVISTAVGGLTDLVVDGHNGLIVEVGHGQQLQQAMKALLTNPTLGRQIAEKAREDVQKAFSTEMVLRKYQDLFQEQNGSARGCPGNWPIGWS